MTQEKSRSQPSFTSTKERQKMIASIVKERRNSLNYTQQELADLSDISLRTIQRIENGEVMPRKYTLKTLSEYLQFSLDIFNQEESEKASNENDSSTSKIILTIFLTTIIILVAIAFIAQSPKFPETTFELLLYCTLIAIVIFIVVLRVWRTSNHIK